MGAVPAALPQQADDRVVLGRPRLLNRQRWRTAENITAQGRSRRRARGGGPRRRHHPAQAGPAAPGTVSPSYRTPEQYERSHIRTAHAAAVGRPGRELDGRAGLPDLLSAGGTHLRPVPRLRRQPTAARPRRKRGTDLPGL